MKKFKFIALVAAVMVITLLSVSGVWAGPMQVDTETSAAGTATGGGQTTVDPATLNPFPGGRIQTLGAVYQSGAGQVCFTVGWADLPVFGPTIRMYNDSGTWTSTGITTTVTPVAEGFMYCADVGAGTFGFQGW